MFDLNALFRTPDRPQAWDAFPTPHREFSGEAWEASPQVNPRDPGFRQLAVPEHARVHHDDSEFEVASYVNLIPNSFDKRQLAEFSTQQLAQPPVPDQAPNELQDKASDQTESSASDPSLGDGQSSDSPESNNGELDSEHINPAQDAALNADSSDESSTLRSADESSATTLETLSTESQTFAPVTTAAESDAVWQKRLDEAVEHARQHALQEGIEQGRALALTDAIDQALIEAKDKWAQEVQADQTKAIEEAVSQALIDQAKQMEEQHAERDVRLTELMAAIDQDLTNALEQATSWPEAIKRLSVHIAEQLVLGELAASPAAIQRLIDRCISELDLPHSGLVTVELAPQDHDLIKSQPEITWNGMELVMNPQLGSGSVKVSCKDTRVSDLIIHRLEPMARQLLVAVDEWQQQSAFRPGHVPARPSFQSAKAAVPSAITPLGVSGRLIDSSESGDGHG